MGFAELLASYQPVGWWRLGEAGGPAIDASGNGVTGTRNGSPTGGQGGALNDVQPSTFFNNTDAYFSMTAPVVGAVSAMSVGGWWKSSDSTVLHVLVNQRTAGNVGGFTLENPSANGWRFYIYSGGSFTPAISTVVGTDGKWHFVVGTWDGTNIRLYFDGLLIAGPTAKAGPLNNPGSQLFYIAKSATAASFLNASLQDVFVLKSALLPPQVKALYEARTLPVFVPRRSRADVQPIPSTITYGYGSN